MFLLKAVIARDFSLMCQSFGMTSAALTILMMKIKVDWYSIYYTTLGGFPGIILGIRYVFPSLHPPYPKVGRVESPSPLPITERRKRRRPLSPLF